MDVDMDVEVAMLNVKQPDGEETRPALPCEGGAPVYFNISGRQFQTYTKTLQRHPETLLGDPARLHKYDNKADNQHCFDRNPSCFGAILNYYQHGGSLDCPLHVPIDIFLEELEFYGISNKDVSKLKHREGINSLPRMLGPLAALCESFIYSVPTFIMLMVVYGIMIFVCAVVARELERDHNPGFEKLSTSIYWAVVTWTSVGYGDVIPSTRAGRVVAVLCAVVGMLSMVLPLLVLMYNFNYSFEDKGKRNKKAKQIIESPIAENTKTEAGKDDITFNASGTRFITSVNTLNQYPDSLLGNPQTRQAFHNKDQQEFFFDIDPLCFESILNFYQTGGLLWRPLHISREKFLKQISFFRLGQNVIENYKRDEGIDDTVCMKVPLHASCRQKAWYVMEFPESSTIARIWAIISMTVLILSIITSFVEDRVQFDLMAIDLFCFCFFVAEMVLRFLLCPSKLAYLKNILNHLDLLVVSLYISELFVQRSVSRTFYVVRVIRLIRLIRLFRPLQGMVVIFKTFIASAMDLFILLTLFIAMALGFGITFLVAENEHFNYTICDGIWYALVTMTTVGYGDFIPVTCFGRVVATGCCLVGGVAMTLPITILATRFKYLMSRAGHMI